MTSERSDDLPHYGLYIEGGWTDASDGATIPVNESALGRPMAYAANGGVEDVDRAVRAARTAFDNGPWPHTAPQERARILHAIADLMEEQSAELAELESRNLGVALRKSMFVDVPMAIEHFRTFAELARKHPYEPLPWTDMPSVSWNFVWREPIGVCGQILAWNYPLLFVAWKMAPALAAGSTVVLKPASYTPLTAIRLFELIHNSGLLPRGTINLVTGPGGEVGEAIARHPGVDKVSLTGSTEVGRRVMQLASATVKRVTLELGGKSPSIVLPDADLDLATDGVLFGVFFNGGQSCESGTRCFVPEALHDEFVARLVARARSLRLGDPLDLETDMGPLVSEKQRDSVMRYIEIGKAEGATLATGGQAGRVPGFEQAPFVEPTIFANVRNSSRMAQEEIFGPVLAVIPYKSVTEAIQMANGTIWINDHHLILPHAPFGGYKQSGVGREHGIHGLLEYTQVKHIHVDLMQKREGRLWWDMLLPPEE